MVAGAWVVTGVAVVAASGSLNLRTVHATRCTAGEVRETGWHAQRLEQECIRQQTQCLAEGIMIDHHEPFYPGFLRWRLTWALSASLDRAYVSSLTCRWESSCIRMTTVCSSCTHLGGGLGASCSAAAGQAQRERSSHQRLDLPEQQAGYCHQTTLTLTWHLLSCTVYVKYLNNACPPIAQSALRSSVPTWRSVAGP